MAIPILGAIGAAFKTIGPLARLGLVVVIIYAVTTVDLQSAFQSLITPF